MLFGPQIEEHVTVDDVGISEEHLNAKMHLYVEIFLAGIPTFREFYRKWSWDGKHYYLY